MASSSISKPSYHARSISLPSRLHPVAEQLNEQLIRLRSSQSTSTSSSSSINQTLNGLNDVYSSVDEFLQLNLNQHNYLDQTLDQSLRLIDICTISRDVLQNSKTYLQDLQSVLRRRFSGDLSIPSEVNQYLQCRKTVKKTVKRCLQSIKPVKNNGEILTEVEIVTVEIFKSLLSYVGGGEDVKSIKSRWSKVANLVNQKSEKVNVTSDFEALDDAVYSICYKKKTGVNVSEIEGLRSQMVKLEEDIEEVDEVLECLFRHLVKTRASLLNMISN